MVAVLSSFLVHERNFSEENQERAVVYSDHTTQVVVPERPLATNALQIEGSQLPPEEVYACIQKISRIWKKEGISSFMTFGKNEDKAPFHWQVVPYPQSGWRLWNQLKVLWRITFGAPKLSETARLQCAERYKQLFDQAVSEMSVSSSTKPLSQPDAFCNPEVIQRQRVYEGKTINVLYNYAPIGLGKRKLHFLIVPKAHRTGFSDLTEAEYAESMKISGKLVDHYKKEGYSTAYLFDKTGVEAGQTVPHWHQHVVFTANKTEELLGKLKIFKNMLFGSSPLPKTELEAQVHALRTELAPVLIV